MVPPQAKVWTPPVATALLTARKLQSTGAALAPTPRQHMVKQNGEVIEHSSHYAVGEHEEANATPDAMQLAEESQAFHAGDQIGTERVSFNN